MALSRIRSSRIISASVPFFTQEGSQVTTFILVQSQVPFYKYTGVLDNISLS